MTLYRAFFALFLALAAIVSPAIAAAPAQAATCTTVWLVGPSFNDKFQAGQKRCVWPADKTNGWVNLYQFNDRTRPIVDWIPSWGYTTTAPNNGLYKPNADRVRALAAKYNVRLQFAYKARESVGCTGIWAGQVNGTYYTNPGKPGKGLVRLGTGKISACMQNRAEAMNTARHEIAHALTERKCPNVFDEPRFENITDAYAWKYLNASNKAPGNYGFTSKDLARATEIAQRKC